MISITEAGGVDHNPDQVAPDEDSPNHKEQDDLAVRRQQSQRQASCYRFGVASLLGYSATHSGPAACDIALPRIPRAECVSSLTGTDELLAPASLAGAFPIPQAARGNYIVANGRFQTFSGFASLSAREEKAATFRRAASKITGSESIVRLGSANESGQQLLKLAAHQKGQAEAGHPEGDERRQ